MGAIALQYLAMDGTEIKTPYGFYEVLEADKYKGAVTRNRVVLRLDLLSGLTMHFNDESLTKYRELIYTVMSGKNIDASFVSQVFTALYQSDEVFAKTLGEIVYFSEDIYKSTFYVVILKLLVASYSSVKQHATTEVEANGYKFMFESKGYLYLSVPDAYKEVRLPKEYKEEVISVPKIWAKQIIKY